MKRIAFFILTIVCFAACNNEVDMEKPQEEQGRIELLMPDAEEVNVYSSASTSECTIDKIWVLEFNTSGALVNNQLIDGSNIVVNTKNQAAQLLPQLNTVPTVGNTIVCIANSDITATPIPTGVTLANVNEKFPLSSKVYYSGGDNLPMYGRMNWTGTEYTCQMTRSVVKVQVQMGTSVSDVTGNFSAENVTFKIYNCARAGAIENGKYGTAQTAQYATPAFNLVQKNNATEAQRNAYIHAFQSATKTGLGATIANNKTFHKDRQCIILEKNNTPGANTFYRLDFYQAFDSAFLDTERNHHYLFTINKVRSEGYSTANEAFNNSGSNIEYVIQTGSGSSAATSNGQYAIVTTVDTAFIAGSSALTNYFISNVRYVDPTGVLATTVNSIAVASASPSGSLSLVAPSPATISAANKEIRITTTAAFTEGVILCKLGNIQHRLVVKKR